MLQAYTVVRGGGGGEGRKNVGFILITSSVELIMPDSSRERLLM